MKTLRLFTLGLFAAALMTGCGEKAADQVVPQADVREQATGTYAFKSTTEVNGEITGQNTGTFTVKKAAADAKTLEFFREGKLEFRAVNVSTITKGFTFEVPEQQLGGETIVGYNGFESGVNDARYHGGFETATKKLHLYFTVKGDDTRVIAMEATPQ